MPRPIVAAIAGWYPYCDGRIYQLQLRPYIIAVYSTLTLEYIIKDHISKTTYKGYGRSQKHVRNKCYKKVLELSKIYS